MVAFTRTEMDEIASFSPDVERAKDRAEKRGTHVMTLRGKGLLLEATGTGETTTCRH